MSLRVHYVVDLKSGVRPFAQSAQGKPPHSKIGQRHCATPVLDAALAVAFSLTIQPSLSWTMRWP
jgi:hypothetical protein